VACFENTSAFEEVLSNWVKQGERVLQIFGRFSKKR